MCPNSLTARLGTGCGRGLTVQDRYHHTRTETLDSVQDETETETLDSETEAKTKTSTGLETEPVALGDIWHNLHC